MSEPLPRLTVAQAAARLGVKSATVYAYVSRGLLSRERDARGSHFDALEVEAFAATRRRGSAPRPTTGMPLMVVETDVADIEDGELLYRGRRARDLIAQPFEEVVAWLWGTPPVTAPPAAVAAARAMVAALPSSADSLDRIRAAIAGLAAADPLRHEASAGAAFRIGGTLVTGLPAALQQGAPDAGPEASVARSLVRAFDAPDADATVRAVDAALVLLIDHDLAVSTFAARVAASARADGYAAVGAAVGAADSPLHIRASIRAARLVAHVRDGADPARALAHAAEHGTGLPGFGHVLYDGVDDRADALLPLVADLPDGERTLAAIDRLSDVALDRAGLRPNVDLALAALTCAAALPDDAGPAIFLEGRLAGWTAHIAAEYGERPLRLRPRGSYVGP